MVDDYGYPTEVDIEGILDFYGTPADFVDYIEDIFVNGSVSHVWETDEWGREWRVVRLVTLGWSGCEETVSAVNKTMFSFAFHSKWERGGLFEYRVNKEMWWQADSFWGEIGRISK